MVADSEMEWVAAADPAEVMLAAEEDWGMKRKGSRLRKRWNNDKWNPESEVDITALAMVRYWAEAQGVERR